MKFPKGIILSSVAFTLLSSCKKEQNVKPQVSIPNVVTTAVIDITSKSAKSGGKVTYDGSGTISEKGICWNINQFPTVENNKTINGAGAGDFSASMTGLFKGTSYYVRAYATDANGTVYGNEIKFTPSSLDAIDNKGKRLYIYPVDNATVSWGTSGLTTGANSASDGSVNTTAISTLTGNYAAKVCADLNAFDFSDWYLPSKEELNLMYQNKTILNITTGVYWSSTEVTANEASSQNMQSGVQYDNAQKNTPNICRCVRKD